MIDLFLFAALDNDELTDEFEKFVNQYKETLMHVAMGVLHNYHDAEEAVIDCFVAISKRFSSFSQFDVPAKRAFACRAARNCALNILNKRNRRLDRELPLDDVENFSSLDKELEKLCEKDTVKKIAECICMLPEKYRDILYLHFAEGETSKKIAKTLGMNHKTVQTRLLRGKKMLKELLEGKV